jgi:DNA-binding NarL/FixJ family response regulator
VGVLAAQAQSADPGPVDELTARELEILELVDAGLSNKEIAAHLAIEVATVKNHVHHILEKLGVHRRAEAVAVMRRSRVPRVHDLP